MEGCCYFAFDPCRPSNYANIPLLLFEIAVKHELSRGIISSIAGPVWKPVAWSGATDTAVVPSRGCTSRRRRLTEMKWRMPFHGCLSISTWLADNMSLTCVLSVSRGAYECPFCKQREDSRFQSDIICPIFYLYAIIFGIWSAACMFVLIVSLFRSCCPTRFHLGSGKPWLFF